MVKSAAMRRELGKTLWIVAGCGLLLLAGCSPGRQPGGQSSEKVINIYNWSDYIAPDTIANFEKEYGIKVNYDFYDSSEMVDAKMLAGASGYDIVFHSSQFSSRLIPLGIFEPLDKSRLKNLGLIDPIIVKQIAAYKSVGDYGVPYLWGSTGVSYNVDLVKERIPELPDSIGELVFNPEYVARLSDCGVSYLDSGSDVIPMVLAHLGLDPNAVDQESIGRAEELVASVRKQIRYFSSSKMLMDLPNKEICVAMSWSGDYATASARAADAGIDINLRYLVPKEGGGLWFDGMFIPTDATHKDNAYLFLDYMMRPEVIAGVTNFVNYANAVPSSKKWLRPEVLENPAIYPDSETMQRLFIVLPLDPKLERIRNRAWARIKSGI